MKKVLTIAGSDCSGGAGIQADLKTMLANGVYGMSVITALTAQNTTGVYGIMEASADFVAKQIDCVFQDIRPDAVKIGMVSNAQLIQIIAEKLKEYKAENIVVDPVMVATSGAKLLNDDATDTLINQLIPLATVITPNIPEAEVLNSNIKINNKDDMLKSAEKISQMLSGYVLLKGGHLQDSSDDLLYRNKNDFKWFNGKRIDTNNTHGTGCTLSSAIASNLAKGQSIQLAVQNAKKYVFDCLSARLSLGKGSGPMDHGAVGIIK